MLVIGLLIGNQDGLVTDSDRDTNRADISRVTREVLVNEDAVIYWVLGYPKPTIVPTATPSPTVTPYPTEIPTDAPVVVQAAPIVQTGGWAELVCQYDWDCGYALAIIPCESGGNPNAYNPAGPYIGLFQVLNGSSDPAVNVAQAYAKYASGGWAHWPNCP